MTASLLQRAIVIDVRAVRKQTGLSQSQFSAIYHIPLRVLRSWEQGRRTPKYHVETYLHLIATNPSRMERLIKRLSNDNSPE